MSNPNNFGKKFNLNPFEHRKWHDRNKLLATALPDIITERPLTSDIPFILSSILSKFIFFILVKE